MAKKKDKFKDILLNSGYKEEELKKMSVGKMQELVDQVKDASVALSDVKESGQLSLFEDLMIGEKSVAVEQAVAEEIKVKTPEIYSPEWTKYVISMLQKDEMIDGCPKTDGLLRVARQLLGPFSIETDVIQVPAIENTERATVKTTLLFKDSGLSFSGSADSNSSNTDKPFGKFPVAIAETRSTGRAVRRALMLTQVLSAEEKSIEAEKSDVSIDMITASMITSLRIMCDRNGINPLKLANVLGFSVEALDGLTKAQAITISNKISKYSTKEEEVPVEILI